MPSSGAAWDYASQFLTSGWQTWNADGQFPVNYARAASAHGYTPIFTFYIMGGTAQTDLGNLNSTSTMLGYYQNFTLLMQRLAAYGGPVIIDLEPDFPGYAQGAVLNNANCFGYCTAQGNNPSYLSAAVADTGEADVAGYANTFRGYNQALLHLRDVYAPNVLLGFHVTEWGTGVDIGLDTRPDLDVAALGTEAGSFAAQSGTFDVLFNDVADRDAGYYKYVQNTPGAWWDQLNVTVPNFHRWEAYVQAFSSTAGKRVLVAGVPSGNQHFDTENNTSGHYQDNRAEYFFGHVTELAQSGVAGVIFAAGNDQTTHYWDSTGDGTTNPPATCTSDGLSTGSVCANQVSTVSDDDGGFLRMAAQQYYQNGVVTLP